LESSHETLSQAGVLHFPIWCSDHKNVWRKRIAMVRERTGRALYFSNAFNDNAAVTYLASLVPGFSDAFKYVVMAGAVTGGGLTVIANSPNPAGQSILASRFGEVGISPLYLFLGALASTVIDGAILCCFLKCTSRRILALCDIDRSCGSRLAIIIHTHCGDNTVVSPCKRSD
jgi:hypothetical protein